LLEPFRGLFRHPFREPPLDKFQAHCVLVGLLLQPWRQHNLLEAEKIGTSPAGSGDFHSLSNFLVKYRSD
jgi:hypothetical protein